MVPLLISNSLRCLAAQWQMTSVPCRPGLPGFSVQRQPNPISHWNTGTIQGTIEYPDDDCPSTITIHVFSRMMHHLECRKRGEVVIMYRSTVYHTVDKESPFMPTLTVIRDTRYGTVRANHISARIFLHPVFKKSSHNDPESS